jgi:hypothetical protein
VLQRSIESTQLISYYNREDRKIYDRRIDRWEVKETFVFNALYLQGHNIQFQINIEFKTQAEAREIALKYARPLGRLPKVLQDGILNVSIHKGDEDFGGAGRNLVIHDRRGDLYAQQGVLEEVLFHEATHASLDSVHSSSESWQLAQKRDNQFISKYAATHPKREDFAESLLMHFALKKEMIDYPRICK